MRTATLLSSIGLIWAVSLLGFAIEWIPYQLALIPRRLDSLIGIFGMPLVHDSMSHLLANTLPMLVLGGMLVSRGVRYYLLVTLAIVALGGAALWLFGRNAAHIGASGLVFGLFGFLVARGIFERHWRSIAVTVLVVFFYGGMLWGVLPQGGRISWEAHLFGLIAGVVAAHGGSTRESNLGGPDE